MEFVAASYVIWTALGALGSAAGGAAIYWFLKRRALAAHERSYDVVLEFDMHELYRLAQDKSYLEGGRFGVGAIAGDVALLDKRHHLNVAVVGTFNSGKTFVVSRLSGRQLPQGLTVATKGLSLVSVEKHDRRLLLIDTEGHDRIELMDLDNAAAAETALSVDDLCARKLTDSLIRAVATQLASVHVVVTNTSASSFLETCFEVASASPACGTIFVLHNLRHLDTLPAALEYFHTHVRLPNMQESQEAGVRYFSNTITITAAGAALSASVPLSTSATSSAAAAAAASSSSSPPSASQLLGGSGLHRRRVVLVHFLLLNDAAAGGAAHNTRALEIFWQMLRENHLAAPEAAASTVNEALGGAAVQALWRRYYDGVRQLTPVQRLEERPLLADHAKPSAQPAATITTATSSTSATTSTGGKT